MDQYCYTEIIPEGNIFCQPKINITENTLQEDNIKFKKEFLHLTNNKKYIIYGNKLIRFNKIQLLYNNSDILIKKLIYMIIFIIFYFFLMVLIQI